MHLKINQFIFGKDSFRVNWVAKPLEQYEWTEHWNNSIYFHSFHLIKLFFTWMVSMWIFRCKIFSERRTIQYCRLPFAVCPMKLIIHNEKLYWITHTNTYTYTKHGLTTAALYFWFRLLIPYTYNESEPFIDAGALSPFGWHCIVEIRTNFVHFIILWSGYFADIILIISMHNCMLNRFIVNL